MTQNITLRIDHICKQFRDGSSPPVTAVEDVDFTVERGEIICIMGPSGCGKSTVLRIIDGLEASDGGRIVASDGTREFHPSAAMVFQEHALFPWLTVFENIAYGLRLSVRGMKKDAIEALVAENIRLFGLEGFAASLPYQLSGGMRQRVSIARALIVKPDILLMDEPFSALDPGSRQALEDEIIRIRDETGTTILLVTHSPEEAIYVADRIVVLTRRPAKVREIVPVPLARPRSVLDPEFLSIRQRVSRLISG